MSKYKKGDIIPVKVNGIEYKTIIDTDDVQRFIQNTCVRHIVNKINMNDLNIDYLNGKFTLRDYMEFYMQIGYSVCGFDEVFGIHSTWLNKNHQAVIENPFWD